MRAKSQSKQATPAWSKIPPESKECAIHFAIKVTMSMSLTSHDHVGLPLSTQLNSSIQTQQLQLDCTEMFIPGRCVGRCFDKEGSASGEP